MDKKAKSLNPQREAATQPAVSSFHHLNIFWSSLKPLKSAKVQSNLQRIHQQLFELDKKKLANFK